MAILGAHRVWMTQTPSAKPHYITSPIEHKSVQKVFEYLEETGQAEVTYLQVNRDGMISLAELESKFRPNTKLVSIIAASNEIGTIQPLSAIGKLCREKNILFHTDATQAIGKIAIDVDSMQIDLLAFSAHKIYGPKGVGALYARQTPYKVRLEPLMYGGGHEKGMRPGTLNTPGIVGMGKACELAKKLLPIETTKLAKLRDNFASELLNEIRQTYPAVHVKVNGHPTEKICNNLSITFSGLNTANFLGFVHSRIALSTGSACATSAIDPSHVLLAIGHSDEEAFSTLRISIGKHTTELELNEARTVILEAIGKTLALNPLR